MYFSDGVRSDHGGVGAAGVCKHGNEWRSRRSYLGTGHFEVSYAQRWAIALSLNVPIQKRKMLHWHGSQAVVAFSNSQAAIRWTAHVELGCGEPVARWTVWSAQALLTHGIATEIHRIPGHSSIPRNGEADRQANPIWEGSGSMTIEWPNTSASNSARRISKGSSAAKAQSEADKCSEYFGYRPKGDSGSNRPIPMASAKSLATWFYKLNYGHAPTRAYQQWFGHQEDFKWWWWGGMAAQTLEHLFHHRRQWTYQLGNSGRRWGRQWAQKRASAGGDKYCSCFPRRYVISHWWTSWRPQMPESSLWDEAWRLERLVC